jgi:hypothetical protein
MADGFWNRAGRRSGGYRPSVIVPTRPLSPEEEQAEAIRAHREGVRNGSPLALIVQAIIDHHPEFKDGFPPAFFSDLAPREANRAR